MAAMLYFGGDVVRATEPPAPKSPTSDRQVQDEPITLGTIGTIVGIAAGAALIWTAIRTCTSTTTCKWVDAAPQQGPAGARPTSGEKEKQKISVTTTKYTLGAAIGTGLPGDAEPFLPAPGYDMSDSTLVMMSLAETPGTTPFMSVEHRDMLYHFNRLSPEFVADDTVIYDVIKQTVGGFRRWAPPTGPDSLTFDLTSPGFSLTTFDIPATAAHMAYEWFVTSPELGVLFQSSGTLEQGQMPTISGDIDPTQFLLSPGRIELSSFERRVAVPLPPGMDSVHYEILFEVHARAWKAAPENAPPTLWDAYALDADHIEVVFDRDVVPASATDVLNYTLASLGSVDGATMTAGNVVLLTVSGAAAPGDVEGVTVAGIVGSAAGLTMTSPASREFVMGALAPSDVQTADPGALADPTCVDRSLFAGAGGEIGVGEAGPRVTLEGVATGRFGQTYYLSNLGGGTRGGVAVQASPSELVPGERYRLIGRVRERQGETEFCSIVKLTELGTAGLVTPVNTTVGLARLDVCDMSSAILSGEDLEGMLVRLPFVRVVDGSPADPDRFWVADPLTPDTIAVESLNEVLGTLVPPAVGDLVTVIGVLHHDTDGFRVCPRSYDDIADHGVGDVGPDGGVLSFSVAPNPARTAKFSFTLPQASDVKIGIYDVAGREVATLVDAHLPAGSFSREWSGADTQGRTVGAGVYFARMKANGVERAIRTVYLGR